MTILLIDDDTDILHTLGDILEQVGYGLIRCKNGKEALDALENDDADVIITDIIMPVMDGYQFIRAVRKKANYSDIPIIVFTGHDDKIEELEAVRNDMYAYLTKPIDIRQLVSLLKNIESENG